MIAALCLAAMFACGYLPRRSKAGKHLPNDAWRPAPLLQSSDRDGVGSVRSVSQPLRQTEGFVRSLIELMHLDLTVPDHTTLSRRRRTVAVTDFRWPRKGPVDRVIDGTGLKFYGAGEWARAKHGESRRSWRKLHISGNPDDNEIIAFELTDDDTRMRR